MQLSVLPLNPRKIFGLPIFDFKRLSSPSCLRFNYVGLNTVPIKSGDVSVKAYRASSAFQLAKEHNLNVHATVGVKFMFTKAKISTSFSSTVKSNREQRQNRTWEYRSAKQIDEGYRVIITDTMKPRLHPDFLWLLDTHCYAPLLAYEEMLAKMESQEDEDPEECESFEKKVILDNCLSKIFEERSHFLLSADVGSEAIKVSECSLDFKPTSRTQNSLLFATQRINLLEIGCD